MVSVIKFSFVFTVLITRDGTINHKAVIFDLVVKI